MVTHQGPLGQYKTGPEMSEPQAQSAKLLTTYARGGCVHFYASLYF